MRMQLRAMHQHRLRAEIRRDTSAWFCMRTLVHRAECCIIVREEGCDALTDAERHSSSCGCCGCRGGDCSGCRRTTVEGRPAIAARTGRHLHRILVGSDDSSVHQTRLQELSAAAMRATRVGAGGGSRDSHRLLFLSFTFTSCSPFTHGGYRRRDASVALEVWQAELRLRASATAGLCCSVPLSAAAHSHQRTLASSTRHTTPTSNSSRRASSRRLQRAGTDSSRRCSSSPHPPPHRHSTALDCSSSHSSHERRS